ncbi:protein phosphatase 2C family protein [Actinidia rufa]|uniref:protein-serine/threonine phosphatase n=1 Tax=Actinidia rufa TaxID=165716 RepID=A0A7J0DXJ1_9ERIC|nr:protein phosphatase 2C family protein [Actinidia rufa]
MGIYLSTPKTEKFSEDGENDRLRYGLSSMQGWRATMEDAHAAYPDLDASTSFFGVYDGHGGKVVAKFCAKYLHQQVLKNEAYSAGDIGTSIHKAFFRLCSSLEISSHLHSTLYKAYILESRWYVFHISQKLMDEMMRGQRGWRELAVLGDKINKLSGMIEGLIWSPRSGEGNDQVEDWAFEEGPHSDFSGPTSGSTACVAAIRNNQLLVANAGDSRCVISRKGQAYNLSRDHKPDLEVERERILKAGGFIHAGRVNGSLNLARAIGDMEFKQNKFLPAEKQIVTANPDINTVELCDDDDFIVLACDGIWDCMSSQQLVDFVREQLNTESKLSLVCERVLDKCLAPSTAGGEGCDNMTMILVKFNKPIHSATTATAEEQSSSSNQADTEPKPVDTESSS